jgi:hypothetical protein
MLLLNLILFAILSIICFTIPGLLILSKVKKQFDDFENFFLSTVAGFVFFTLLSYFLWVLQIHFLLLVVIVILNLFYFKVIRKLPNFTFKISKHSLILQTIFLFGVLGQLAVIAPSGLTVNGDILFWSAHGHDGPWHIALAEEIKKGYPFQNPVFAGEKLVNYHFFSDITLSDFNNLFKLPLFDLYFRFFPLLFSILLGGTAFILGKRMTNSNLGGYWAAIFTYFVGSFGYIATLNKNGTIGGESIFWGTQIQSSIGNPPQIISNFLVLALLTFLFIYFKQKSWTLFGICVTIAGSLVLFKIYAALAVFGALTIVSIWEFISQRKFYVSLLLILSCGLSAILYFPNSAMAGAFLIWEPWWFIRTMIVTEGRLDWLDHELRRQTYIYENNLKRVIQLEVTAFMIFFFGNLGIRFIGLFSFVKMLINLFRNNFNLLFILIILISLIFPLLYLQKGVAGNTSQSLQYFILLFGILAAITISELFTKVKNMFFKILITIIIIVIGLPTQAGLLYEFYSRPAFAKISRDEIVALNLLKENSPSNSIILTPPYDQYLDLKSSTPQIWDWFDSAYVAAISGRRTYFSDYEQVDIMGYDYKDRYKLQQEIFTATSSDIVIPKLRENNISYIYFPKTLAPKFEPNENLEIFYQSPTVEIWKVNP